MYVCYLIYLWKSFRWRELHFAVTENDNDNVSHGLIAILKNDFENKHRSYSTDLLFLYI